MSLDRVSRLRLPYLCGWAVLVLCVLAQRACAQWDGSEQSRRMSELLSVRLGEMALVIHGASDGKSRLLVSSGATAWASLSRIYRSTNWGDLPHARAYRVSQPFDADLDGVGKCRLLGALFLSKEADIIGGGEVPIGVHLIANDPGSGRIIVIDVRVHGDGRVTYRKLGGVKTELHRATTKPYVTAVFPNMEPLQDDNPPYRLTLDFAWEQEGYMFRLLDLRPMF